MSAQAICLTCNAPSSGDYCTRCREAVVAMVGRAQAVVELGRTIGVPARCSCRRPRRHAVCVEQMAFAWRREVRG